MNKTIARRNRGPLVMTKSWHARQPRGQARNNSLQKWWNKYGDTDYGPFKRWGRQEKKQFLLPGPKAYDKWVHRNQKRLATDPNYLFSCGRHVIVPQDVCWSADRKLRMSLVKANAQGRRRRG